MPINLSGELVQVIITGILSALFSVTSYKLKDKELNQLSTINLEVNCQERNKSCILIFILKKKPTP
jgi:hypothetical protein